MTAVKYNLAFAGGLFQQESIKIALLYMEKRDWNQVSRSVLEDNLLQTRTVSSLKRYCREIISRLKTLYENELELLIYGNDLEQKHLLWLTVCRRYQFIRDFAVEVFRERYLALRQDLHYEDYDSFFNAKAEWHEELEKIKPTTRNKLRQVLLRILREAGLLTADNTIIPAVLTPRFINVLSINEQQDFLIFPIMESELKEWFQ